MKENKGDEEEYGVSEKGSIWKKKEEKVINDKSSNCCNVFEFFLLWFN
jgi:hypothetical protein